MRRGGRVGGRRAARRTVRRTARRRMMLPMGRRWRRRRFLVGGFTMLLVGGAAYKLGQSSVQLIEQHTGKPAEELTEQELEAAMDELGIKEEELTDQDMAAINAEAVGESTPTSPTAAPAQPDYITQLERLADLRDKGIITDDEFQAKKRQLLGL